MRKKNLKLIISLSIVYVLSIVECATPSRGGGGGGTNSGDVSSLHYKSRLITENVWLIEDSSLDSMYLVLGNAKAALIDTGMGTGDLKSYVNNLAGGLPVIVLVTHGHIDHSSQAGQFDTVYFPAKDADPSLPSYMFVIPENYININNGDKFDLGGRTLEAIEVPGHTPGSIVFLDAANRMLFSGDAVGSGVSSGGTWMHLDGCLSIQAYLESLKNLELRKGEFDKIYPGHIHLTKYVPQDSEEVTDIRITAEKIIAGEITGKAFPYGGNGNGLVASYQTGAIVYLPTNILSH